ncbi:hypothetical protein MSPP1_000284 [Malassezia sp. CBS 17886]|nr:hypothetical protein MSPP1_000284 [Malassezia sp. CBS 17886]
MAEQDEAPLLEEARLYDVMDEQAGAFPPQPRRHLYAPLSYEQAMAPQRPAWHPVSWYRWIQEHTHLFDVLRPSAGVKSALSRTHIVLQALWPQNRVHQTLLAAVSLWLLMSYANWAVSVTMPDRATDEDLYWSYSEMIEHEIGAVHLSPRPGDGRVVANATWAPERCYSTGQPLRFLSAIRCETHTQFNFSAMPSPDSPRTTDHTFLYIDPDMRDDAHFLKRRDARAAQSETPGRLSRGGAGPGGPAENATAHRRPAAAEPRAPYGRAPANVYLVTRAPDPDDSPLRGQVVVNITAVYDKRARMLLDHSLVAKLAQGKFTEGVAILTPALQHHRRQSHVSLRFDVVVSFPGDADVDAFMVNGVAATVQAFTKEAHQYAALPMTAPPPKSAPPLAPQAPRSIGKLNMFSRTGSIALGGDINATGEVWVSTVLGSLECMANITSRSIALLTNVGSVRIASNAVLHGQSDVQVRSKLGTIMLEPRAHVYGIRTAVHTDVGSILGTGIWHANFSLAMSTTTGLINADVEVNRPALAHLPYEDFVRADRGRLVRTNLTTATGSVIANYVAHEPGIPLDAYARADMGSVHVSHGRWFEGALSISGAAADLQAEDLAPGRHVDDVQRGAREALRFVTARTWWDAASRSSLPNVPGFPPPIDEGKSPLEYGARSTAESRTGEAKLLLML